MAFVTSALSSTVITPLRTTAKVSAVRGSRAVVAVAPRRANVVRMVGEQYPSSDVLGLGKDVPSFLYALSSAPAFVFGCWAVYQSNIANILTAGNVEYV